MEVKARGRISLLEALRQAESSAEMGDISAVVWRHNGQGESCFDWTVTMRLGQFEQILKRMRGVKL